MNSNSQLNLEIGPYRIDIVNRQDKEYLLPQKAEQFLVPPLTYEDADMHYTILTEEEFHEEQQEPPVEFCDYGPHPYRLYQCCNGEYLWIRKNYKNEIKLVYRIKNGWNDWQLIYDRQDRYGIHSFEDLVYFFAYSILQKDGILFHGVVMEWNKMGIVVCAHSGVGKTTHTRMWRDHENALILDGDRALCCMEEEQWFTYGAPWCGSSKEYRNQRAPLRAFVILEQYEENEVCVLDPLQGVLGLLQLAFAPSWDSSLMNAAIDTIDKVAQTLPVLKLKCQPNLDAVKILKAELEKIYQVNELI